MIVSEIQTYIKRQFGDESGVQVTDADILRWINSAQKQIVLQNESLLEKTTTTNTVIGQQVYTLPVDLLKLSAVSYRNSTTTAYFRLKGYSLSEFNEKVDGWDGSTESGDPFCYTISENNIILYPVPNTAVLAGLKVYYNRKPVVVTLTTDTPELPELYHDTIIKFCLQQAYEVDEDWDAVGNKAQEFDREVNLLRGTSEWKTQEHYPVINVLNEDAW
jgi:hypothetical protein